MHYKVYLVVHVAQNVLFKKDRFSSKAILRLAKNILQTYALVIKCGFMAKMTMFKATKLVSDPVALKWTVQFCAAIAFSDILRKKLKVGGIRHEYIT